MGVLGIGFSRFVVAGMSVVAVCVAAPSAGISGPVRVSVGPSAAEGNDGSFQASVSANGRFVVFYSSASNLVASDENGFDDVFLLDRATGLTTRVSVDSAGTESNEASDSPSISANGKVVVFPSDASNLVAADDNGSGDFFAHDTRTGATTVISAAPDGSPANGYSYGFRVSSKGRFAAFYSDGTDLVAGDGNGVRDAFVRDLKEGTTVRTSVGPEGAEGNGSSRSWSVSSNGRFAVLDSVATNLVADDTNGVRDIFVRDTVAGVTTRVSVSTEGTAGNGDSSYADISANGRFVVFSSDASNLVPGDTNGTTDIFLHDRKTATTTRLSVAAGGTEGNSGSVVPTIAANGRVACWTSSATNLVPGDTNATGDVFVRDLKKGSLSRVSVDAAGGEANGSSGYGVLSATGRFLAFYSSATNLVAGDTNGESDAFLVDRK